MTVTTRKIMRKNVENRLDAERMVGFSDLEESEKCTIRETFPTNGRIKKSSVYRNRRKKM